MAFRFGLLSLLTGIVFLPTLHAGPFDAIYAFGDSLTDVGNIFASTGGAEPAAPYYMGEFSNGPIWIQDFAASLGLGALAPSLLGGTDYAYGSAETGVTSFNTALAATDLLGSTGQLTQFKQTHATADPSALYVIWIGSNDLFDILASSPTPGQAAADIGIVAGNIDTAITTLAGIGAKDFLIVNVPDLGAVPASGMSSAASALSAGFNSALVSSLPALAPGDAISVLNSYSLLDSIVADPAVFGLTNVTNPCYTGTYAGFADTADPGTVCANPNSYLFWDSVHPTAAADFAVADAALALVTPEPASISLIAAGLFGLVLIRRWL